MDVREKLVELVNDVLMYLPWGEIEKDTAERIVDRIMDHDVTVQEWISVDDELPEAWKQVLIYSRHDFCESAVYIGVPGKWRVTWNHEMLEADSVTHWMPLPEMPKGE